KYRSTAVGSLFRKISIMAWRALAPKVPEVMAIHSDRDCSLGGRSGYDETRRNESGPAVAVVNLGICQLKGCGLRLNLRRMDFWGSRQLSWHAKTGSLTV